MNASTEHTATPRSADHSGRPLNWVWRQQWVFTLKELRETLRDRRTIVTLLAMPLLLYPLLGLGFRYMALAGYQSGESAYRVALRTEAEARWLQQALLRGNALLTESGTAADQFHITGESPSSEQTPEIDFLTPEEGEHIDLQQLVADGDVDLGVMIGFRDQPLDVDLPGARVDLIRREGSLAGLESAEWISQRLDALRDANRSRQPAATGDRSALPLTHAIARVEPTQNPNALLSLLPLILLLMTVTGGVYPAIDLTAGERERDTLETLMALPVPRHQLLLAKFVAVVTVTLLTGGINLLAMSITMYALQLETLLFGSAGLSLMLLLKLCGVLACFATFYATVLLLVTCSARSFKEAQAYLIPLLLLSLSPGMVILLPGWHLNLMTATLPLVNMLLLAREIFEGTATWGPALLALSATLCYAGAALSLAARIFGTDAVGAGSGQGWQDLLRRPESIRQVPDTQTAWLLLAALFPIYFVASGLLSRLETDALQWRLLLSGLMTACLFGGLPWLVLRWQRIPWRSGFSCLRPRWQAWPGVLLLGFFTWPWVFEGVVWWNLLRPESIRAEHFEQVAELLTAWQAVPFPLVLLALAVLPGVCEEFFFRGLFLNGMRQHLGGWLSVLLAAVAFGVFHLVMAGGLSPERVLPSTVIGLILGWVAWQSGSVLPAMLLHVLHNSALLTLARYQEQLSGWQLGNLETMHLPASWLIASALCITLGLRLVRRPRTQTQPLSA